MRHCENFPSLDTSYHGSLDTSYLSWAFTCHYTPQKWEICQKVLDKVWELSALAVISLRMLHAVRSPSIPRAKTDEMQSSLLSQLRLQLFQVPRWSRSCDIPRRPLFNSARLTSSRGRIFCSSLPTLRHRQLRAFSSQLSNSEPDSMSSFHDLKAELPGGKVYDFQDLKGQVVLVVNVASKWCVMLSGSQDVTDFPNMAIGVVAVVSPPSTRVRILSALRS